MEESTYDWNKFLDNLEIVKNFLTAQGFACEGTTSKGITPKKNLRGKINI